MKKWAFVVIAFSILLSGFIFFSKTSVISKRDDSTKSAVTLNDLSNVNEEINSNKEARKREKLLSLKSALQMMANSSENESDTIEEEELADPEYTEAELAEHAYMKEEIDAIFFDMAPSVFHKMLENQPKDVHWQTRVNSKITNLLDNAKMQDVSHLDTSCGTTLCKVVLDIPDKDTLTEFHKLWIVQGPTMGTDFGDVKETETGLVELNVYFSKEDGEPLYLAAREELLDIVNSRNTLE